MDLDVTVSEYVDSLEEAMIEVWTLMETLYLHFQISEQYKAVVEENFPSFADKIKKKKPRGTNESDGGITPAPDDNA